MQIWCEDCGKYISEKTRHFQSEIHKADVASHTASHTPYHTTPRTFAHFGQEGEVIVNETAYIKLKLNPTSSLENQNNDSLRTSFFPRYKYQLSYLAKFIKNGEEEIVFYKWIKSDFNHNHTRVNHTQDSIHEALHNSIMQKIDDEQLEGSGFKFQEIKEVILETYKVIDIKASSWVELPEKYKNNKSIINIKMMINFVFCGVFKHTYF